MCERSRSINMRPYGTRQLIRKNMLAKRHSLFQGANLKRGAQLVVLLLCATVVKFYYSTASVNQLRWILAPTTFLVELVSGNQFEFESHAGYLNSGHTFVIAASCAGVNFLITAFLMLSLRNWWRAGSRGKSLNLNWRFIPAAAMFAYLATLVANTVRIATALQTREARFKASWLDPNQLHRLEGIFVYFGFLLLLFLVSERMNSGNTVLEKRASMLRGAFFPLMIYYATTLGVPLVNGACRSSTTATDFWEHAVFVLLTPLLLILPLAIFRFHKHLIQGIRH